MAWTLTTTITLGPAYAGLSDLRAQLFDTAGTNVGAAITTGFSADLAAGRGQYVWSYAAMPDGHRGGVRFYSNAASAASSVIRSVTAEDENAIKGVALSTAERQKDLRRIYGVSGTVWCASASGGSDSNDGLTWDTAFATLDHAVIAASAGDRVLLGPGTHAYGNAVVTRKNGVSIKGAGIDVTVVTSSALIETAGGKGCVLQLGDNLLLEDLTVRTSTTTNVFAAAIGADQQATPAQTTGASSLVLRRVKLVGWSDCLYFDGGDWSFTAYDCVFVSNYDALAIQSDWTVDADLHNCTFAVTGLAGETHPCRGINHQGLGTVRLFGGSITVTNAGTGAVQGANMSSSDGRVELYGVQFNTSAEGGGGATDLVQQFGGLVASGCDYATSSGTVTIINSGAPIAWSSTGNSFSTTDR